MGRNRKTTEREIADGIPEGVSMTSRGEQEGERG
jgi:hypothetical protein